MCHSMRPVPENADTTGATGATALPETGLELVAYRRLKRHPAPSSVQ